ncbi:hypothetical protein LEMLEM_LOCUS3543 [Lemmus lemmus]
MCTCRGQKTTCRIHSSPSTMFTGIFNPSCRESTASVNGATLNICEGVRLTERVQRANLKSKLQEPQTATSQFRPSSGGRTKAQANEHSKTKPRC